MQSTTSFSDCSSNKACMRAQILAPSGLFFSCINILCLTSSVSVPNSFLQKFKNGVSVIPILCRRFRYTSSWFFPWINLLCFYFVFQFLFIHSFDIMDVGFSEHDVELKVYLYFSISSRPILSTIVHDIMRVGWSEY